MTAPVATAPPAWANWLGAGGLIPFVVLALAHWWPASGQQGAISHALASYGATIASFLGATGDWPCETCQVLGLGPTCGA